MYLHIPIHNVQSDCLDYDMNIFTQKDHSVEWTVNFQNFEIKPQKRRKFMFL